jgi:hypothetical protein
MSERTGETTKDYLTRLYSVLILNPFDFSALASLFEIYKRTADMNKFFVVKPVRKFYLNRKFHFLASPNYEVSVEEDGIILVEMENGNICVSSGYRNLGVYQSREDGRSRISANGLNHERSSKMRFLMDFPKNVVKRKFLEEYLESAMFEGKLTELPLSTSR